MNEDLFQEIADGCLSSLKDGEYSLYRCIERLQKSNEYIDTFHNMTFTRRVAEIGTVQELERIKLAQTLMLQPKLPKVYEAMDQSVSLMERYTKNILTIVDNERDKHQDVDTLKTKLETLKQETEDLQHQRQQLLNSNQLKKETIQKQAVTLEAKLALEKKCYPLEKIKEEMKQELELESKRKVLQLRQEFKELEVEWEQLVEKEKRLKGLEHTLQLKENKVTRKPLNHLKDLPGLEAFNLIYQHLKQLEPNRTLDSGLVKELETHLETIQTEVQENLVPQIQLKPEDLELKFEQLIRSCYGNQAYARTAAKVLTKLNNSEQKSIPINALLLDFPIEQEHRHHLSKVIFILLKLDILATEAYYQVDQDTQSNSTDDLAFGKNSQLVLKLNI